MFSCSVKFSDDIIMEASLIHATYYSRGVGDHIGMKPHEPHEHSTRIAYQNTNREETDLKMSVSRLASVVLYTASYHQSANGLQNKSPLHYFQ